MLALGLGSGTAISAVGGPRDAVAMEIQSDEVAVVQEFLAIDNLSADRDFVFQRSDLRHFARLPGAAGNHAGAMSTDVIRTGQLCSVGRLILQLGKAHNNGDWQAFLHASVESALKAHFAQLRGGICDARLVGVSRTANRSSVFLSTFNIEMLSCIAGKDLKTESCQFLSSSIVLRAISRACEREYCFRPRSRSAWKHGLARARRVTRSRLVDGAVEDGGDLAHFVGEGDEFLGEERLHAVGEGFFRLVMDFDEQAVGADSDSGARKRQNFVALAGAVAGVDKNGKMAAFFYGGNDGEVERVARKIRERSNAPLAEHDVVIALGEDVLRGHQELVERGGHAALEEYGFLGAAGAFEQREVLHVARADLDDVGVFFDEVERFIVNCFSDDAEAVGGADFRKNLEAVFAEALEAVRRSAGLVSAAAEEAHAGFFEAFGDGEALLFGFDGTGAGNEGDLIAADDDVAGGRGDSNDAVFLLGVAADQFVRFADRDALDDAGKGFEDAEVDGAPVAGDADGGAQGPRHGVGLQSEAFNALADFADLLLGS